MKAAKYTLDSVVVERPLEKQNLCLDKGYDFPEIERESVKRRYVPHIRHRSEELIKKIFSKEMGCRMNKFMT
jgi:putative transposase